MKYMMLICWDAERMDAQTEPDPTDTPVEDSFPWLDDIKARGISVAGDRLAPPRRARTVRVRDGKAIITDGRSPRPRRSSAGSTSLSAAASKRPSRSRPGTLSPSQGRSRFGHSGETDAGSVGFPA